MTHYIALKKVLALIEKMLSKANAHQTIEVRGREWLSIFAPFSEIRCPECGLKWIRHSGDIVTGDLSFSMLRNPRNGESEIRFYCVACESELLRTGHKQLRMEV